MKLTELLQASEIALPRGRTNPWPAAGIHIMNMADGLRLNGSTLTTLETRVVEPSSHVHMANEKILTTGFKVNGNMVKWPKVGTQPYSTTNEDNQILSITTPKTILLWWDSVGQILKVKIGSNKPQPLGASATAPYATTCRRGIRYVIAHCTAGGGGGGSQWGAYRGWGGGSGTGLVVLIRVTPFTETNPLTFVVPAGGYAGDAEGGPGGNFIITSNCPHHNGTVTLPGGTGAEHGAGQWSSSYRGRGGAKAQFTVGEPLLFDLAGLNNYPVDKGQDGGGDLSSEQKRNGGAPTYYYVDPNPTQQSLNTNISFWTNNRRSGQGGRGGNNSNDDGGKKGQVGGDGGLYLFY